MRLATVSTQALCFVHVFVSGDVTVWWSLAYIRKHAFLFLCLKCLCVKRDQWIFNIFPRKSDGFFSRWKWEKKNKLKMCIFYVCEQTRNIRKTASKVCQKNHHTTKLKRRFFHSKANVIWWFKLELSRDATVRRPHWRPAKRQALHGELCGSENWPL